MWIARICARLQGPGDDAAFGIVGPATQRLRTGASLAGVHAGFASLRLYARVPVDRPKGVSALMAPRYPGCIGAPFQFLSPLFNSLPSVDNDFQSCSGPSAAAGSAGHRTPSSAWPQSCGTRQLYQRRIGCACRSHRIRRISQHTECHHGWSQRIA